MGSRKNNIDDIPFLGAERSVAGKDPIADIPSLVDDIPNLNPRVRIPSADTREGRGALDALEYVLNSSPVQKLRELSDTTAGKIGSGILERGGHLLSLPAAAVGDLAQAADATLGLPKGVSVSPLKNLSTLYKLKTGQKQNFPDRKSYLLQALKGMVMGNTDIANTANVGRDVFNLPEGPTVPQTGGRMSALDLLGVGGDIAAPGIGPIAAGVRGAGRAATRAGNEIYDNALRFATRDFRKFKSQTNNAPNYLRMLKEARVGEGAKSAADVEKQAEGVADLKLENLNNKYQAAGGEELDFAPNLSAKEQAIKQANEAEKARYAQELAQANATTPAHDLVAAMAEGPEKAKAQAMLDELDAMQPKPAPPQLEEAYLPRLRNRIASEDRAVREAALDELSSQLAPEFAPVFDDIKDALLTPEAPQALQAADQLVYQLGQGKRSLKQARKFKGAEFSLGGANNKIQGQNQLLKGSARAGNIRKATSTDVAGITGDLITDAVEKAGEQSGQGAALKQANTELSTLLRGNKALRARVTTEEGVTKLPTQIEGAIGGGSIALALAQLFAQNPSLATALTTLGAGAGAIGLKKGAQYLSSLHGGTRSGLKLIDIGEGLAQKGSKISELGGTRGARAGSAALRNNIWTRLYNDQEER